MNYQYDEIKEEDVGGVSSTHGEFRNTYQILNGKTEAKRLFRRQAQIGS